MMKAKQEKKFHLVLGITFLLFLLCAAGLLVEGFSLVAVIAGNLLAMGTAFWLFFTTLNLERNSQKTAIENQQRSRAARKTLY
ncbi:MAG: hypothetical protein WC966_09220 [Bradymonadales bacterium]|jgi:hypothetical protein